MSCIPLATVDTQELSEGVRISYLYDGYGTGLAKIVTRINLWSLHFSDGIRRGNRFRSV